MNSTSTQFSILGLLIGILCLFHQLDVIQGKITSSSTNRVVETTDQNEQTQTRRTLLGGYTPMNTNDEFVQESARFAVESFLAANPTSMTVTYSFVEEIEEEEEEEEERGGKRGEKNFRIRILEASQQVVAGVNIRLSMALFNKNKCLGGVSGVIVYKDLQNEFSVTSNGHEMRCDVINKILQTDDKEDE